MAVTPYSEEQTKEGPQGVRDYFTIDTPDDQLVRMIDGRIREASKEYEKLKEEGKVNERYWASPGGQLANVNLRWYQTRIVQNRIYMGVETMVPILTARPPEPVVSAANEEMKSKEQAKKLQRALLSKYDSLNQQFLFQMVARHLLLYKIGILKLLWDDSLDDFRVEFVHPHKVIIGSDGYENGDVWIAQYLEKSVKELCGEFPDKEEDILTNFAPGAKISDDSPMLGTPIGYWEYWPEDGSFVVSKYLDVILQKKRNPLLLWKDDEFDKENNFLQEPRKPFIFLNSQNLGRHIWDDTSPVSQGVSLQDGINIMQRIVADTARDQGILVGAEELIAKEELYKYTGAPDEKLSVKGGDPSRALYRVPPKQLQPFVEAAIVHLENALDNIMGTHSTTRGEKPKEPTLGQSMLSREGDYGRIDGMVRGLERMADELYNWETQIMKIKYKKEHFITMLGKTDAAVMEKFTKDDIKDGTEVTVKQGSTLPTDKLSQRAEAIELAKAGKIDNVTFFERLDFPNPREMAYRLYLQDTKPEMLFPELIKDMEKQLRDQAKKEGRVGPDGKVIPEQSIAAQQVPPMQPPGPAPAAPLPSAAVESPHRARLLAGEAVLPFDGIQPSQEHVTDELTFMASPELAAYPEQIQAIYADHTVKERQMLLGQ